ncbi:MAG: hypothetical protein OER56_03945 [Hyphomicrobiales bacterium]|nr:hypothetical protein [Hyphomicrobiales bacterium]
MTSADDPASAGWHLDKRVPLALIITIFMQTVGAVWFAADLANSVENNTDRIAEIRKKAVGRDRSTGQINERLIRLEEDVKHGNKLLEELVREQRRQSNTIRP